MGEKAGRKSAWALPRWLFSLAQVAASVSSVRSGLPPLPAAAERAGKRRSSRAARRAAALGVSPPQPPCPAVLKDAGERVGGNGRSWVPFPVRSPATEEYDADRIPSVCPPPLYK